MKRRHAPATAASISPRRASSPARTARASCITCPSEKFFRNLCAALDVDWADDPRFATIAQRLANEDELERLLSARCREFGRDELLARLTAADMLVAPVNEIPDVVRDPQILHNGMIVTTEHATLGPIKVTGVPVHLHGTPGSVRLAPPVHGQHTTDLLAELGYGAEAITALRRDGVVATPAELEARTRRAT